MKRSYKPSAGVFASLLLLFLLPFMAVSCNGTVAYEFSGYELAFGSNADGLDVGPYAALIVALLAGVVAALAAWSRQRTGALVLGVVGLAALITFAVQFFAEATDGANESGMAIRVLVRAGFWLSAVALGGGVALAWWAGSADSVTPSYTRVTAPPPPMADPGTD